MENIHIAAKVEDVLSALNEQKQQLESDLEAVSSRIEETGRLLSQLTGSPVAINRNGTDSHEQHPAVLLPGMSVTDACHALAVANGGKLKIRDAAAALVAARIGGFTSFRNAYNGIYYRLRLDDRFAKSSEIGTLVVTDAPKVKQRAEFAERPPRITTNSRDYASYPIPPEFAHFPIARIRSMTLPDAVLELARFIGPKAAFRFRELAIILWHADHCPTAKRPLDIASRVHAVMNYGPRKGNFESTGKGLYRLKEN